MNRDLKLKRFIINVIATLIVSLFFISCNSYYKPVSLMDASQDLNKGFVKVTYNNNQQDVFEKLVIEDGVVYGINSKKNNTPKTELKEEDVIQVEKQKKGVSSRNTIFGVLIAGISFYLITTMF